ncbi:transposase [Sphingomonas sp. ID1715]|jgi:transposase-like protein|uniref:Transposase n=4 Tax=Sphingomonadaceae TaxID=41297 RepID=A0A8G2DVZ1_9SPHN|nr:hypothetical protein BV87_26235 [Sphingobium yanoikuyae]MAC58212.1 hypothetical protein [Novosphingobium sp.]MAM39097.1 hypothetical protein [Erythrobacter sp.]MBJ7440946.1 transposase [Sphingopyxis sp.]MBS48756.1 hypothetical protein [Sphingobium sp.]MBS7671656.1 transposase [Croceicoccus gelatinilyticus]NNM78733.1 transposase [Sphingomonas sp. ID1715]QDH36377.1 transposase [Porphyrobacter sp. YT40]QGP81691.1 transposase [Sphingobium sp. CAP-1]QVM83802.1 transposase [Novosphingobium de
MEKYMGRQRFTPEQIIAKLREVDVIVGRGGTTDEACRQIGIAEQTLYRWRKATAAASYSLIMSVFFAMISSYALRCSTVARA